MNFYLVRPSFPLMSSSARTSLTRHHASSVFSSEEELLEIRTLPYRVSIRRLPQYFGFSFLFIAVSDAALVVEGNVPTSDEVISSVSPRSCVRYLFPNHLSLNASSQAACACDSNKDLQSENGCLRTTNYTLEDLYLH